MAADRTHFSPWSQGHGDPKKSIQQTAPFSSPGPGQARCLVVGEGEVLEARTHKAVYGSLPAVELPFQFRHLEYLF